VASGIQKEDTVMRQAIPAKIKLEITLRYLATGDSLASLQYLYRVPKCTISTFLGEVLDAIYNGLKEHIKVIFVFIKELYFLIKPINISNMLIIIVELKTS